MWYAVINYNLFPLAFKNMKEDIKKVPYEKIRSWDKYRDDYSGNLFYDFFDHLAEAMEKKENTWDFPNEQSSGAIPAGVPSSSKSSHSHSSDEDGPEQPSRLALQDLLKGILRVMNKNDAPYGLKM